MIPPVRLAEVGLEVSGSSAHDDDGWCHEGADDQEYREHGYDDPQPLQQVEVGDLHCLGGPHAENHGNPENKTGVLRPTTIPHNPEVSNTKRNTKNNKKRKKTKHERLKEPGELGHAEF